MTENEATRLPLYHQVSPLALQSNHQAELVTENATQHKTITTLLRTNIPEIELLEESSKFEFKLDSIQATKGYSTLKAQHPQIHTIPPNSHRFLEQNTLCQTLRDDSLSDYYSTSKEISDNNYNTRTSRRSSPEHSKHQSRQNSSRKGSRSVHKAQ